MTYRVLIEKFSGDDGDEVSILDANGVTVLDARDAAFAERVVALLNGAATPATAELRALLATRGVAMERTKDPTWTGSDCALMRADGELMDALLYGSAPVLPALLDRLERMERLLRELEWSSLEGCRVWPEEGEKQYCPACEGHVSTGHAVECELAALLAPP